MNKLPASLDFTDKAITEVEVRKKKTLTAMQHHVDMEKERIVEQLHVLKNQYDRVTMREFLGECIHKSDHYFEPVMNKVYSLYEKNNGGYILSLLSPEDWGEIPYKQFVANVKMLGDSTWEEVNVGV